jgi:hypothetical protein
MFVVTDQNALVASGPTQYGRVAMYIYINAEGKQHPKANRLQEGADINVDVGVKQQTLGYR